MKISAGLGRGDKDKLQVIFQYWKFLISILDFSNFLSVETLKYKIK